jgi:N-acetylmuramoyl-L-alanine amidase
MKKIIVLFLAFCFVISISTMAVAKSGKKISKKGALYGLVVVIDPGHGGTDPGSHGTFNGNPVYEDEYCYDVALRLQRMLKKKEALVFLTVKDKKQKKPIASHPADIIKPDKNEVFALDGSLAKAGSGLNKRVAYANKIKKKYPRHKVVFISIHFDSLPATIEGGRIIQTKTKNEMGKILEGIMIKNERAVKGRAVLVTSGDKSKGIINVWVLGRSNQIKEKILIELGNFSNKDDRWRIRNYKVRENYAQLTTRALIQFMK